MPGIYTDWNECKAQVDKFPNAEFKKFGDYKQARQFFDDEPYKRQTIHKYFGVTKDKASLNTINTYNSKRMKCKNISDYFMKTDTKADTKADTKTNTKADTKADAVSKTNIPTVKKVVINEHNNVTRNIPPRQSPATSNEIKIVNITSDCDEQSDQNNEMISNTINTNTNTIKIYTDGSCLNNGKKNARGGIGVWFGENDPRNISERLRVPKPTNQLAELTAISKAIDTVQLTNTNIIIYTDSDYSIKCVTRYCPSWKRNNWRKKDGGPIKNLEIIQKIYEDYTKYNIQFIHIKAHTNRNDADSIGNSMADKLAVAGSNIQ